VARKVPKTLEELRTEAEHQPANGPSRLPRTPTQKIVNKL